MTLSRHTHLTSHTRLRGAAWSARHPVTVEVAGSNPAGDGLSIDQWLVTDRYSPLATTILARSASGIRTPVSRAGKMGSIPIRANHENASAGHWRASLPVKQSLSSCAGSIPARRTGPIAQGPFGQVVE